MKNVKMTTVVSEYWQIIVMTVCLTRPKKMTIDGAAVGFFIPSANYD